MKMPSNNAMQSKRMVPGEKKRLIMSKILLNRQAFPCGVLPKEWHDPPELP